MVERRHKPIGRRRGSEPAPTSSVILGPLPRGHEIPDSSSTNTEILVYPKQGDVGMCNYKKRQPLPEGQGPNRNDKINNLDGVRTDGEGIWVEE